MQIPFPMGDEDFRLIMSTLQIWAEALVDTDGPEPRGENGQPSYITLSREAVARTEEIIPGVLMVDRDAAGEPVGIEILAPASDKS